MATPYLDIAFAAVVLISGLLAMYRGLSREILSIVSWVAAAGATAYFVLYHKETVEDLAKQLGVQRQIVQVGAGAVVFLVTVIIVHLITMRISDAILDSRIGMIDRILGFAFGAGRAFVIALIVYMFYIFLSPKEEEQHAMVRQSMAVNAMLKPAARVARPLLERLVPPSLTGAPSGTPTGEGQN